MRVPTARNGPVCEFDRTVTPMVDVVFQLLVFFVLASGGRVAEQSLSTVLAAGTATAGQTAVLPKRAVDHWIHLAQSAAKQRTVVELNGQKYEQFSALDGALRELVRAAPDSRVILDIAGDVPLGQVIAVYDACRAARFHSINFAASPEEVGRMTRSEARMTKEMLSTKHE